MRHLWGGERRGEIFCTHRERSCVRTYERKYNENGLFIACVFYLYTNVCVCGICNKYMPNGNYLFSYNYNHTVVKLNIGGKGCSQAYFYEK